MSLARVQESSVFHRIRGSMADLTSSSRTPRVWFPRGRGFFFPSSQHGCTPDREAGPAAVYTLANRPILSISLLVSERWADSYCRQQEGFRSERCERAARHLPCVPRTLGQKAEREDM